MDKESVAKALKELKEKIQKRNFNQTYDLIVTLKGLDLKKPEHQVDFFQLLHKETGKKVQVCALVGPETSESAKENCDLAIRIEDFPKYAKDKKELKKLTVEYEWFIAQANIMPKVAAAFGKVLGPKGKMPNPKVGAVFPPGANLKPLVDKLRKTVRVSAKISPMVQCAVGKEDMSDEEIIDNVLTVYEGLVQHLIGGAGNVKRVLLKLTMGKPVKLS